MKIEIGFRLSYNEKNGFADIMISERFRIGFPRVRSHKDHRNFIRNLNRLKLLGKDIIGS